MPASPAQLALLIIDMQSGLFLPQPPRFDAEGVVTRINALSARVRERGGPVVFVQHDGEPGEPIEPGIPGWEILPTLARLPKDLVVRKRACDAFYETDLGALLAGRGVTALIACGCATDFCVDTTVRSAALRVPRLVVASDAHTTADRPHLPAAAIIAHHNWMWENLIVPGRKVRVATTAEILAGLGPAGA